MGTDLNLAGYEKLIAEDLEWLREQPRTLERDHIEIVLRWSIKALYEMQRMAAASCESDAAMIRGFTQRMRSR